MKISKMSKFFHDLTAPIAMAKTISKLGAEDTKEPEARESFLKIVKLLEELECKIDQSREEIS